MFTYGEYSDGNKVYGVVMTHTKEEVEISLWLDGKLVSCYKKDSHDEYSYLSNKARLLYTVLKIGLSGCNSRNGVSVVFELGTSVVHTFKKSKYDVAIELYNGEIVGAEIADESNTVTIKLHYDKEHKYEQTYLQLVKPVAEYIKLTKQRVVSKSNANDADVEDDLDAVQVRSVKEIALEKEDVSWLKKKKYYVVTDDSQAEEIFNCLENYKGVIAFDTETTGLKINCFGKIGSKYKRDLEIYNAEHTDEQIRADRLVGIILCANPNESYYFPCFNRKFKNLYQTDTQERRNLIAMIQLRYSDPKFCIFHPDMANYIKNTPPEQWGCDVFLMERVRIILETRWLVGHNCSFDWKVGWLYEIDSNFKDDTMIMHQIMYKFRSTTSNRGEPSSLKYLAKRELGIDQWELHDFFPDFKEDSTGMTRSNSKSRVKKKGSKIDFSYMDLEGTRVYAPADGDCTLLLFFLYKQDMIDNHKEQEYIYNIEVVVSCAIAYMEFYGHRIDEEKISAVRDQTIAQIACIESEIRQMVGYATENEGMAYEELKSAMEEFEEVDKSGTKEERERASAKTLEFVDKLRKEIDSNEEHVLNLASPAQVASLFYDVLQIPFSGEKKSVAKREVKALLKAKDDDGNPKYPVVHLYSKYKALDTLLTKFFDNLQYYQYPGGLIFSSFGQISTATGRMSCSRPNCQQYPKAITNIVIPRDGYVMMDADYSQIEYRVLTALAGNEGLAELFKDPDSDYHTLMASMMYDVPYASVTPKMRSDAKSFNFGIPYGMGLGSLAILLTGVNNAATRAEAAEKYELYFKNQPKTRKFFDRVKEGAQINKYTRTHFNRYRYYSFVDADGNENNARKAAALRQAGNAVIQGTAADIFKISVARNFMYIRENCLLGKLLIVNMIHDEQLFEVDVQHLNMQCVLRDIGDRMQFKLDGFPPLYIGAGIGPAWAKAKGKMAEIHPSLLKQLSDEVAGVPVWRDYNDWNTYVNPKDVLKYFADKVLDFRRQKVKEYLLNPENYGKDLHPAIGNLLNLQFSYGHDKASEGLSDSEFTMLCLKEFIEHEGLTGVDASNFIAQQEQTQDTEEDAEYSDGEDDDTLDEDSGVNEMTFTLIDESDNKFGSSLYDIIKEFGFIVSKNMRVCGIDVHTIGYKRLEQLVSYLSEHVCEPEDDGAMEVVFLKDDNVLTRTNLYVNGISGSDLEIKMRRLVESV